MKAVRRQIGLAAEKVQTQAIFCPYKHKFPLSGAAGSGAAAPIWVREIHPIFLLQQTPSKGKALTFRACRNGAFSFFFPPFLRVLVLWRRALGNACRAAPLPPAQGHAQSICMEQGCRGTEHPGPTPPQPHFISSKAFLFCLKISSPVQIHGVTRNYSILPAPMLRAMLHLTGAPLCIHYSVHTHMEQGSGLG